MNEAYVCLASYNCVCRPPGKAVSLSTMKRHRGIANERRKQFGLNTLQRGPKFSLGSSAEQRVIHGQLFANYVLRIGEHSRSILTGSEDAQVRLFVGDYSPPCSHLQSSIQARPCSAPTAGTTADVLRSKDVEMGEIAANNMSSPFLTPVRDEGERPSSSGHREIIALPSATAHTAANSEEQILEHEAETFAEFESMSHNSSHAENISISNNLFDLQDRLQSSDEVEHASPRRSDDIMHHESSDETESSLPQHALGESGAQINRWILESREWRGDSFASFLDWCKENKRWVELGVEYGLKRTVMDNILRNLDAPYKSWNTIKRNMIKYSELQTVKYRICPGHELLTTNDVQARDEERVAELNPCSVCVKLRQVQPDTDTFEYIPLLPRLKTWVSSRQTMSQLYDYRWRLSASRENQSSPELYYEDCYHGMLCQSLIHSRGGEEAAKFDIFLDVSTDGFSVYSRAQYDCWPLIAMIHNLHPSIRFLMHNVLPLGFIKGPREPVRLDTFLIPLIEELNSINNGSGTKLKFADGVQRSVKVHLIWAKGDGPASQKVGGLVGAKGKRMCRFCDIDGHYYSARKSYYFPSKVKLSNNRSRSRMHWKEYYDPSRLPARSQSDVKRQWRKLADERISDTRRKELTRNYGITRRTVLYDVAHIVPFHSLPLDIMHLTMNMVRSIMMPLWKGDQVAATNLHDSNCNISEDYIINQSSWISIDAEIRKLGCGTSESVFGRRARETIWYTQWKAEECRMFIMYYAVVLLNGHIPKKILDGIRKLSDLFELCFRPQLSQSDVEQVARLSIEFFDHYEKNYFKYDEARVHLSKSTVHALLHLAENIDHCGPLLLCSQFWMERYVGFVKQRLNATYKPAESLTENAKLFESYRLFLGDHFKDNDDKSGGNEDNETAIEIGTSAGTSFLPPQKTVGIDSNTFGRWSIRSLLLRYARQTWCNCTEEDLNGILSDEDIKVHGRARKGCEAGEIDLGSLLMKRETRQRCNYLIAAQFDADEYERQVFYGRILLFLEYTFTIKNRREKQFLYLAEWVSGLQKDRMDEVFNPYCGERVFTGDRSIEWVGTVSHGIGMFEHYNPRERWRRTYFIDTQRRVHRLLDKGAKSPDGIDRYLVDVSD